MSSDTPLIISVVLLVVSIIGAAVALMALFGVFNPPPIDTSAITYGPPIDDGQPTYPSCSDEFGPPCQTSKSKQLSWW